MTKQDDERFRVRPRPPRARDARRLSTFLGRVQLELGRAGALPRLGARAGHRPGARIGRGYAATRLGAKALGPRARRVTIKARVVVLKSVTPAAIAAHLRYIARDGVGRDGQSPEQPYGPSSDSVDLDAFRERSAGDRHQFRFIVSAEDAAELDDLKAFTRQLMAKMEADLGTRLDWAAVNHWDTDNPHTHVVLRGKDDRGRDLVIAGDYIAKGMRLRASEVATLWLGPRTDLEIQTSLQRELEQERWTSLDRQLKARERDGVVDLGIDLDKPGELRHRTLLIGRLQRLQAFGLARTDDQGQWQLRHDAEEVLRHLGERGDIIKTMQRALGDDPRELAIFDPGTASDPVVGRIAGKGLVDELGDQAFVAVDGIDGRAHHVALPRNVEPEHLPLGGIVEVRAVGERAADQNIHAVARDGLYRPADHLAALRAAPNHRGDADHIVASHVRRLEALRRAGIVTRIEEGVWRVPHDLVERGKQYDLRRLGSVRVELLSQLPVERQVRALGATWLDQQLVDRVKIATTAGFGAQVQRALDQRERFLVERRFADQRGSRVLLPRNLLAVLRDQELTTVGKRLANETGLQFRGLREGQRVSGIYRRSMQLVSGRFALLDDGLGFSLVPWRPVIEQRLGQSISAVVRGTHVSWLLGRQRGPSIGM